MLSKELITELQEIIAEEYGYELTAEEAAEAASSLVRYFSLLNQINKHSINIPNGQRLD